MEFTLEEQPLDIPNPASVAKLTPDSFNGLNFFQMGCGSESIIFDIQTGFYLGGENFLTAPFSVSMAGKVKATNFESIGGTITGGTITGATVKATGGASGVDVWMDSSDGNLKFYYAGAAIGKILTDSANLIYDAPIHFFRTGATQFLQIKSDGLLLPSSKAVIFTGGGRIKDNGAYLKVEGAEGGVCDFQVEGNVYPNADNARQCGTSDKRWQDVNSEDIHVDDLTINSSTSWGGSSGKSGSTRVLTAIDYDGDQLRYKYRDIGFNLGGLSEWGGESGWNNVS